MMETYGNKLNNNIFLNQNLVSSFKNNFSKTNVLNQNNNNINNTLSSSLYYIKEKFQSKYNIYKDGHTKTNRGFTEEDLNEMILTRLITSGISIFLCLICMIIYFCICIKKRIEIEAENREKTVRISHLTKNEDLNDLEENKDEKNERFLTYEDDEEENTKPNNIFHSKEKENDCSAVSFEKVLVQNKSIDLSNNIYNPYSSNHISNSNSSVHIINQYEDRTISNINPIELSNTNIKALKKEENIKIEIDIVNHFITNQSLPINNDQKRNSDFHENLNTINNINVTNDADIYKQNDEFYNNRKNSKEYFNNLKEDFRSNSYNSRESFNDESKEDKKIKLGIINNILLFLILTNMGFAACSFIITDAYDLRKEFIQDNCRCIPQAFFQNFFDCSAICLTTVISLLMRESQRFVILKKLAPMYKWYIMYSILVPLILSLGPLLTDSFGSTGPWCWVDTYEDVAINIFWSYLIYIFCWANIFVMTYKFYKLIKYFNSRCEEIKFNQNKLEERKYIKKNKYVMYAFPIILILTKIPATINRCFVLISGFQWKLLYHLQASFSVSIGIFNSIVFIFIYRRFIFKRK